MSQNTTTSFKNLLLLILFFWGGILQTYSQEITFHSKKFGIEDGLPSTEVYEIMQDKKGYIWLCTELGVSRFDGYNFKNFGPNEGLPSNTTFHMYEDYLDRLWFLPWNNELSYYWKDSIYIYQYNDKLKDALGESWITSISVDTNETLRFAGRRYGYGTIDKHGNLIYQSTVASDTGIVSYYQNEEDLLIYGLKANTGSTVDLFYSEKAKPDTITYDKFKQSASDIYHYKLSDSTFILKIDNILCLKTNKGIKYHSKKFPKANRIIQIYADHKGRIWISSYNKGVKIYDSIEAVFDNTKPSKHLFKSKNISGIYEDHTGAIWLAVQNSGAYYISNMNVELYLLGNDELTNRVSGIFKDSDDQIFVSTFNSKIFEINENKSPKLLFKNVLSNNHTIYNFRFVKDKEKKLVPLTGKYTLTRDGVSWGCLRNRLIVTKNNIPQFELTQKSKNTRFNVVYEDYKNKIWVGTNNGLMYYSGDSLISVNTSKLFTHNISDINELSDGTLLIATFNNGLIIWSEKEIIHLNQSDGMASNIIRSIHVDEEDYIWLSSSKGLIRLVKNESNYSIHNITHANGLPSNEVNAINSVGTTIWVATNKGLACFNKNDIKINDTPPVLHLESISINDKNVRIKNTYELPYDQNYLEIGFIGLSYKAGDDIVYRYKMEGIDENWIETTARSIRYPSLSHGNYTFHLKAANEDGIWTKVKNIRIYINPPYWKTTWFILFCMFAFIALVYLLFKQKEQKQRKKSEQKKLLEREKLQTIKAELKALRAQMNPHFTFNTLSAIQTAVNKSDTETASKHIGSFATLIRKVLENSKLPFISLHEELEMLRLYIELEQLRFSNKFSYEINTDENLDLHFHEIPSMVIQPFIENAILHGLAPKQGLGGQLLLNISIHENTISCVIQDNGIGRKAAAEIKSRKGLTHESMAMEITEDRMGYYREKTGEDYSVTIKDLYDAIENPKGTKVMLIFPV